MKPAPPISCSTTRSPGASEGSTVSLVVGCTTSCGSPVWVSTRRPSGDEKKRIVIPLVPAKASTSTPASQSLVKISSGPPNESVASRPLG